MTTNLNNVIELSPYQAAIQKSKEAARRFPIIYAINSPSGDPIILFRFALPDEEEKTNSYNNNIVPFPARAALN